MLPSALVIEPARFWCPVVTANLWNQRFSCLQRRFHHQTAAQLCPDRLENNHLYHFNVFTGCRGHSWPAGLKGTADKRHYPALRSCHCSQFDLISLPQLDLNHCNSSTLYQLTVKLISLDFVCTDQKWLSRLSRVPMSQKSTRQLQRTQHGKLEDESRHLAMMSQGDQRICTLQDHN